MSVRSSFLALMASAGAITLLACTESSAPNEPDILASVTALPPGAIPVNSCGDRIQSPGDYWLTRDLTNCTNTLATISVEGDGVVLHLNGHRIQAGLKPQTMTCVAVTGANNTIRGPGTLGFCLKGVTVSGSGNTVRGLKLSAFDLGVEVSGSNNTFQNLTFAGQGYAAFLVVGTTGNVFRNNRITDRLENGFIIRSSTNQLIELNRITGPGYGMLLETGADQNIVRNNEVAFAGNGIVVSGIGNQVSGNIFRENGWDMTDTNLEACLVNTWTGNRFRTASPDCLQ
jgi:hypothetical protein